MRGEQIQVFTVMNESESMGGLRGFFVLACSIHRDYPFLYGRWISFFRPMITALRLMLDST